ncbi:MAG TPA: quinolinate synthase NadA [Spirochaetia bacterium]|nr:quinolinate synthase NadA [Spirochaetales bacterium]HRS66194.1 quinolinate synthase NadA [Spirochaetia bacterium]HOT59749.1 quinolinate synthase NadA [Spirochaetales bacterium]HPD80605.1 quinolinate synthase NadA [Spirochaetales bacterium]HQK33304.1 quinolinate synthase NadA [Spirochaetales bacterium]
MNSPDTQNMELIHKIQNIKQQLGTSVVIPAHHYMPPEVVAISDFIGDSYKLAVLASKTDAEYIILCGVRFMAESAAILARAGTEHPQTVLTPDPVSGCPMADMIDAIQFKLLITMLQKKLQKAIIPVTYMNSYADVKALTGEYNGSICTSSNAEAIVRHFIEQDKPVFFTPDRNLGLNTAHKLGIPDRKVFIIDKTGTIQGEGNPTEGLLFIWDGFCHVHKNFTLHDIKRVREQYPGIQIIVHPECDPEVVQAADASGSTEGMYAKLKNAPGGSVWAVGTEINFVKRAATEFTDKTIIPLKESLCFNMARINLEKVLASLESILNHKAVPDNPLKFKLSVDASVKSLAEKALRTMIDLTGKSQ